MAEAGVLILICGLPGAGKTTLAKSLEVSRGGIRFSPDDWIESLVADPLNTSERDRLRDPVENLQWDFAKQLLQNGQRVILENGFWGEEERYQYAMEAISLGATVELFLLTAPTFDALWERVSARNGSVTSPLWVMSREDLVNAWNAFQAPTQQELDFYDEAYLIEFDCAV